MNLSAYIFGRFSEGKTQYPSDYTYSIFNKFIEISSGDDEILTHRCGDLVYYGYIRKLSEGNLFGVCVVLNDLLFNTPTELFPIFESIFAKVVMDGDFVKLGDNGSLVPAVVFLHQKNQKCDQLNSMIVSQFKGCNLSTSKLPPENFSVGIDEVKKIAIDEDTSEMTSQISSYPYTVISRPEAVNTDGLSDYISTVKRLNKEKEAINTSLESLKEEHAKLRRSKNKVQLVVVLLLGLIISGIVLFSVRDNLLMTQESLRDVQEELGKANSIIENQKIDLNKMGDSILIINLNYHIESNARKRAEDELEQKKEIINNIESRIPLLITNVEVANIRQDGSVIDNYGSKIYSRNTRYLTPKITYVAFVSETVSLKIKLYTPSGLSRGESISYSYKNSFDCMVGSSAQTLGGYGDNSNGSWESGKYTFEFWYGDYCVGSHSFIIY